jgi:hypothetical protein
MSQPRQISDCSVSLTDNTATELFSVVLPTTGDTFGAIVRYFIRATDGTDFQAVTGQFTVSVVNKAGTLTAAVAAVATEAKALSAGTCAQTSSVATSGTKATVKLAADTSLTPTSMECWYEVRPFSSGTNTGKTIPILNPTQLFPY